MNSDLRPSNVAPCLSAHPHAPFRTSVKIGESSCPGNAGCGSFSPSRLKTFAPTNTLLNTIRPRKSPSKTRKTRLFIPNPANVGRKQLKCIVSSCSRRSDEAHLFPLPTATSPPEKRPLPTVSVHIRPPKTPVKPHSSTLNIRRSAQFDLEILPTTKVVFSNISAGTTSTHAK